MAVFGKHAYTHACVTRASQDIASLPIKLLRGQGEAQTEIDDHPVLDLFRQPSSITDGYLFREQFIVDLMMTGNVFTLIVGDPKSPTSLYRLHPENVRIIPDPIKMIEGYEYSDGGSSVVYPPERVIQIRSASWDNGSAGELYGSGIVEALNEEITADINAQRMASSVSKQGRPDVLLSPADPADIWDRRRRQEIMQAYKQMTEHGGAMALSGQDTDRGVEPIPARSRVSGFAGNGTRKHQRRLWSAVNSARLARCKLCHSKTGYDHILRDPTKAGAQT